MTETCDTDHALNLVTNVLVDTAGAADCDFLQTAVEITKDIVTGKIETVNADGSYHSPENQNYCKEKEIDTCLLRKQINGRDVWPYVSTIRNNVEATIFQLGYHYPNAKSRYRGIVKHKMWANLRCFWINFVRIANYVADGSPYCAQKLVNRWILPRFSALHAQTGLVLSPFLHILTKCGDILSFIFGYPKLIPIFAQNSKKVKF